VQQRRKVQVVGAGDLDPLQRRRQLGGKHELEPIF
jgi:hypothetical protein